MLLMAAAMCAWGPIPQLSNYHSFADTRSWFGIPNAADVVSNIGFALVGAWGLAVLLPYRSDGRLPRGSRGYLLFVVSLLLTALGSSWYHLAPDNARLFWDRTPIALLCAGLLLAVEGETRSDEQPRWLLYAMIAAAIASVGWWRVTEVHGAEDLRPYLFLQAATLVLIPLWQALRTAPRCDRIAFGVAIALYILAKLTEVADHAIFADVGFISGHTLKHLLSVAASAVLVGNLARRVPRQHFLPRKGDLPCSLS
ncbi:MAG TPA: alkaline phytoceramidase [Usitatibacter sp.]|jgi:predicted membrane channel-forming protein YqfA (hemolysin III family)|nr:alkaline phytoceramidase [Usitatibacter sp.]